MKINYVLDDNNYIIGYTEIPFDPSKPSIEVDSIRLVHVGFSQVIDGVLIENEAAYIRAKKAIQERKVITDEIAELKRNLANTDYESLKFSEGEMTAEEFEPYKVQRHAWRLRIRELEEQLEEAE